MTTQIAVETVDVPKKWRKVKKSSVASLADSLQREGLLHAIGVRLDEKSGRYILVYGRHRLEAARKIGWTEIAATVIPSGLPEEMYLALTGAENLFRTDLAPAERVLALKQWHTKYAAAHPETVGKAAGAEGLNRKLGRGQDDEPLTHNEQDIPEEPAPAPDPIKTFTQHACDVTGMDLKTVERYLYSGKNLTEEQLLVLATAKVAHEQIKKINKLTEQQIAAVVSLVASGCNVKEAISEATLPPGATMETVGDPENPVAEEDLSDEEWVIQQCGDVLERLKYTHVFYADAILYRQIREARNKLRNAAKKPLAQARAKAAGPFFSLVARIANIDHPKNWQPCGPCGGTGMSGDNSKCGTCKGDAFLIRKESR